jgi:hypothetical protein
LLVDQQQLLLLLLLLLLRVTKAITRTEERPRSPELRSMRRFGQTRWRCALQVSVVVARAHTHARTHSHSRTHTHARARVHVRVRAFPRPI